MHMKFERLLSKSLTTLEVMTDYLVVHTGLGVSERCVRLKHRATRGVAVSMSAFLACHQCYCAGSSLAWGLNLSAVVCGIF